MLSLLVLAFFKLLYNSEGILLLSKVYQYDINHLCAAQVIVELCPGGNITLTCTACSYLLAWDSPVIPDSPGALVFSLSTEVGHVEAYCSLQAILVNKTGGCLTSNLTATASPPVVNGTGIYCSGLEGSTVQNWTILVAGDIDLDCT